jgi:hypothetical protein
MTIFTVHAPGKADGAAVDPAELVFVKDGFSWPALFIPPVWLVWHRQWLTLLIWVVAVIVLSILSGLAGSDASTAVMILFAFWFALEANGLRRWTLERRGYVLVGVVEGRRLEDAERRYFGAAELADPADATPPAPPPRAARTATPRHDPPPPPPSPRREPGVVGLFPAPGHRP